MTSLAYKYAGAGWLADQLAAMNRPPASAFGATVANILGETFAGIYHVPESSLFHERTEWASRTYICVTVRGELATQDGAQLSQLVFLSHAHGVRLAIHGASNGYLRLAFSINSPGNVMYYGAVPDPATLVERFNARYAPLSVPTPSDGGR